MITFASLTYANALFPKRATFISLLKIMAAEFLACQIINRDLFFNPQESRSITDNQRLGSWAEDLMLT